jgi:hypothetical protein
MLRLWFLILTGVLAGCASIPDVDYNYYLSKMNGVASIAQTISCAQDMQSMSIVNTPSFSATYAADLSRGPYHIGIRDIEGTFSGFADSDVSFGFYDDGRLKSVNQSTTGQGEAAIKSIVSLGTTIVGLGVGRLAEAKPSPECEIVKSWSDPGKMSVSLSYRAEVNFPNNPPATPSITIEPGETSRELFSLLNKNNRLPRFQLWIGRASDTGSRAVERSSGDGGSNGAYVNLTLQRVATVEVRITADQKSIWQGNVPIPAGQTYELPIPKAALFGGQKFSVSLSEAGAITAIDYSKTSGAAGAANAGVSIGTALTPETTANRAADLKAQADLIAQQQRLHRCQTNPANCN